jgi:hypothetical protein
MAGRSGRRQQESAMPVRDYDPRQGQAFQGDLAIIPVPNDVAIATDEETRPVEGRLIFSLGKRNGCDHAISLGDDLPGTAQAPVAQSGATAQTGTAHLYRDPAAAEQMVTRGLLTRSIGINCLVVTGGAVVISHPEHDGIRVPPGNYLIVRQTAGPFLGEPRYI